MDLTLCFSVSLFLVFVSIRFLYIEEPSYPARQIEKAFNSNFSLGKTLEMQHTQGQHLTECNSVLAHQNGDNRDNSAGRRTKDSRTKCGCSVQQTNRLAV